jgi:hypothetical protein
MKKENLIKAVQAEKGARQMEFEKWKSKTKLRSYLYAC